MFEEDTVEFGVDAVLKLDLLLTRFDVNID
jgi:hypothetical protein